MRLAAILFIIPIIIFTSICSYAADVKNADLAGSWYPASKTQLENQLKSYLDAANPPKVEGKILAVIVPHAGYPYSGPIAAYGYKAIQNKGIKTVIVIGFSHRQYFDGIAIYDRGYWRTPLGDIQIDEVLAKDIEAKNPHVLFNPNLFKEENSVEMQIPFIQMISPGLKSLETGGQAGVETIKIVPIAFGTQNYEDAQSLSVTLASVLKDRNDCIIAASTDLSHYHSYNEANNIDRHTINVLNKLNGKEFYDEGKLGICELCGLMPVTAALLVAEKLGYDKIKELKYANSGDITGDKSRVVGYLSAMIYKEETRDKEQVTTKEESKMLNDAQRKRLLEIARESITSYVKDGKRKTFTEKDPLLNQPMGAFVTLHEAGELRGCIGNMVGTDPLYQTVADMAIEAATGDPRFQRLSAKEIDNIKIEISVLSPLKKVKNADEIKIPGQGVIVRQGFRSGVYLPQVADETGWNKEEFLTSLCAHKARLSPDAWKDPETELYTFTAEVFGEGGK
jgi:AmmeMemoRadiSam system protein B/AmmeMemoRadiSam system protein A